MGVNIPNIRTVIHFGPPRDLEDYMQEIGRAGRDGSPAEARLYYKSIHLLGCSEDMKVFTKNKTACRRQLLLDHFTDSGKHNELSDLRLNCCDVCSGIDTALSTSFEHSQKVYRSMDEDDKVLLCSVLSDLKTEYSDVTFSFGLKVWPEGLVDEVVSHYVNIDSIEDVAELLPIIHEPLALKLFHAVKEVADEQCTISPDALKYLKEFEQDVSFCEVFDWSNSESESDSEFALAMDEDEDVEVVY